MEKISGKKQENWVYYKDVGPIPDALLGLTISTMDFSVIERFIPGTLPEDRAFHELIRNPKLIKEDFIIKKEDILPFIASLEEATGGKGTFRHLRITTPTIRDDKWNLKLIRLYLSPLNNGFVVCDRFSRAIRWKEIIPNINYKVLDKRDSTKLLEDDQR